MAVGFWGGGSWQSFIDIARDMLNSRYVCVWSIKLFLARCYVVAKVYKVLYT